MEDDSVARKTIEFVKEYPFIMFALKKNLINYSSLARMIQKDIGIKNFDAILVALRRCQKDIRASDSGKKLSHILKNSKLEIKTGVNIYSFKNLDHKILEKFNNFHLIYGGPNKVELITDEKIKMQPRRNNLVEVKIVTPPIEDVPGVVNRICNAFAERNINIVKTYSCHTDCSFFVFEKKDLSRVVDALEHIGIM